VEKSYFKLVPAFDNRNYCNNRKILLIPVQLSRKIVKIKPNYLIAYLNKINIKKLNAQLNKLSEIIN
jgi:hypothetical protein